MAGGNINRIRFIVAGDVAACQSAPYAFLK